MPGPSTTVSFGNLICCSENKVSWLASWPRAWPVPGEPCGEYLTSSGAIFGGEGDAPLDQALQGIDPRLLRLEACFSHEKRMEKIIAVFPRTFQILGADQPAIVRDFIEACPPIDISRLENARQFYDFLCARWRDEPPEPPYLRDVATCEFGCAMVRVGAKARELEPARREHVPRDDIRRHPDVILLRCIYDIRPIFEASSGEPVPVKRGTLLAIGIPPDAGHPRIFEMVPAVFDLLSVLDDWTDRTSLGSMPELDVFICDLAERGLIEVRR